MSAGALLLWVVIPYVALTIFVVGHVWRYRRDQFMWTSRSTQMLESRWLRWGSTLFHYGTFMAIGGHVIGIAIPAAVPDAFGIDEDGYHLISVSAGTLAGVLVLAGFVILLYRRLRFPRVAATTTRTDLVAYGALTAALVTGVIATSGWNLFVSGYDYRETVAPWFRGIFLLDPNPELMTEPPLIYQIHALSASLLYAVWPFTRLVHAWSYPVQYLGRPYIIYRRRYAPARTGGR
jgi:nitrate reductase gamma subunit